LLDTVTIGTSDTTGTLLVIDTKTGAGDPAGTNGGIYYNSNAGKFRCYQNSAWTDCIGAGGGGITTVGSLNGGTANANGATISSSTIYLQSASTSFAGLVDTTTQSFAGDKTFTGNVTADNNLTVDTNTLYVDATNNRIGIGTTTTTQAGVTVNLGAPDVSNGAVFGVSGTLTSTTNSLFGIGVQPTVTVGVNSDLDFVGVASGPTTATGNLNTGTAGIFGYLAAPSYTGTGTLRNLVGTTTTLINSSTGTVTNGIGIEVTNPVNAGTITTNYGIWINNQTAGATDYGVYIQGADTYALFVDGGATRLDGTLAVGDTVTITQTTTSAALSATLGNTSGTMTDGILVNRNASGGTTTNGVNITNTVGTTTNGLRLFSAGGTFTNGITFSGTFTKLLNSTNFNVLNSGALSAVGVDAGAGLLQGSLGLTVTGATVSLNANSNFTTNINTGTSTGAVNIGNSAAGQLTLQSGANIVLGTSDTTGTLLVIDTKTGAGDPTGVDGGMYYNSNSGKFRCYENSTWVDCIGVGGSGVTTMAAIGSSPNANGASISGSTLTLQPANGSFGGVVTTGTQTFGGAKTFNGNVTMGGDLTVDTNTLFVDSTNNAIGIGTTSIGTTDGTHRYKIEVSESANYALATNVKNTSNGTSAYAEYRATNDINGTVEFGIGGSGLTGGSGTLYGNRAYIISSNADGMTFNTELGGDILFATSDSQKLLLQDDGDLILGVSDTTGQLLVLDTKTDAGDPTGVDGGMYYNSNAGKFRCYQASAWTDCIGSGSGSGDILNGGQNGAITIGTNDANSLSFETNGTTRLTVSSAGNITSTDSALTFGGTSTSNFRLFLSGTVNSSTTSAQYALQNQVSFNPSGASLSDVYGFINVPALSGSSLTVSNFYGGVNRLDTAAGYTGQISNGYGLRIAAPSLSGNPGAGVAKIVTYTGLYVDGTSNGGNTSGTINNYGLRVASNSAAAGVGGTLNNYGLRITLANGVGGTTTNYGLYLDGNGGGSSDWALYSTSTAASLLSGNLSINGNTTLGDATSDTVTFTGRVNSDILPSTNDTYNLGSDTNRWANAYLGGETIHLGASTSDEATFSYNSSTDSLIFKNATNAATAFQIQNSSSVELLAVDTIASRINVAGDIEATGTISSPVGGFGFMGNYLPQSEDLDDNIYWTATNITVTANATTDPLGNTDADQLTSSASGTHTITHPNNWAGGAGTYTFSIWIKTTSGTQPFTLSINSTGGTPTTGTTRSYTATTAWKRYMVTQTFTGSPTIITPVITMTNNSATIYAYGGQLLEGTSAGVYSSTTYGGMGSQHEWGAVVNGNLRVYNAIYFGNSDSNGTTTLFDGGIQSNTTFAVYSNLFEFHGGGGNPTKLTVDTTSSPVISSGTNMTINIAPNGTGKLTIGTANTTGTLFVLDSKSASGEAAGITAAVNGSMYYNSTDNKFRCYENSAWVNCIGGTLTVGTFSGSSQANGATYSSGTLTFGPADGTNPGMVSTGSQTFAGAKTFGSNLTVSSGTATLGTTSQAGSLVLWDGSGNTVSLNASGIGTNYSLTLPTGAGATGQCLQTDTVTASQLIFGSCASGSGDGGVTSVGGLVDVGTKDGNGAVISGTQLIMQTADATYAGLVSTTTQTFAGNKTFNGTITVANITPSGNLTIGTSDTTGTLLVLDTKTDSGDPTGVEGGMYFNSSSKSFRCFADAVWQDCSSGRVYLTGDVTQTNGGAYTTIFTVPMTASKLNVVEITLLQFTSVNGVAPRNRVRVSASGATGYCTYVTQTSATAQTYDNIIPTTTSADTAETAFIAVSPNPTVNTITCSMTEDASASNLEVTFTAETTGTVTTKAGSYYTKTTY
jgi:hypothetical protein